MLDAVCLERNGARIGLQSPGVARLAQEKRYRTEGLRFQVVGQQ